jgi:segregation and condensation protein A
MASEDVYRIELTDIFEGPMDLLVHLIKKNEVDIYDIPIALITEQFLEYLEWMKSMNIDFAGDFIVMASTLTQIKSRMLLPLHEGDPDEEDDPRQEVTRPLFEYLQMKSAAEDLATRRLLGEDIFARNPIKIEGLIGTDGEMVKIGLFELIDAFQSILEKISPDHLVDLTADSLSVKDRITELVDIFKQQKTLTFDELFAADFNKAEVIVTFLAILEMVKLSLVQTAQQVQTGIIRLFYCG